MKKSIFFLFSSVRIGNWDHQQNKTYYILLNKFTQNINISFQIKLRVYFKNITLYVFMISCPFKFRLVRCIACNDI